MRIPRPVKLGFLTAVAIAFCCKQCLHDPLAATGEDLLSAQQAEIELEKLGIAPDAYSQKQLEAATVREVLEALEACGIPGKDLKGCLMLVNGKSAATRSKLAEGDTVVLMSPVAGG